MNLVRSVAVQRSVSRFFVFLRTIVESEEQGEAGNDRWSGNETGEGVSADDC